MSVTWPTAAVVVMSALPEKTTPTQRTLYTIARAGTHAPTPTTTQAPHNCEIRHRPSTHALTTHAHDTRSRHTLTTHAHNTRSQHTLTNALARPHSRARTHTPYSRCQPSKCSHKNYTQNTQHMRAPTHATHERGEGRYRWRGQVWRGQASPTHAIQRWQGQVSAKLEYTSEQLGLELPVDSVPPTKPQPHGLAHPAALGHSSPPPPTAPMHHSPPQDPTVPGSVVVRGWAAGDDTTAGGSPPGDPLPLAGPPPGPARRRHLFPPWRRSNRIADLPTRSVPT